MKYGWIDGFNEEKKSLAATKKKSLKISQVGQVASEHIYRAFPVEMEEKKLWNLLLKNLSQNFYQKFEYQLQLLVSPSKSRKL